MLTQKKNIYANFNSEWILNSFSIVTKKLTQEKPYSAISLEDGDVVNSEELFISASLNSEWLLNCFSIVTKKIIQEKQYPAICLEDRDVVNAEEKVFICANTEWLLSSFSIVTKKLIQKKPYSAICLLSISNLPLSGFEKFLTVPLSEMLFYTSNRKMKFCFGWTWLCNLFKDAFLD